MRLRLLDLRQSLKDDEFMKVLVSLWVIWWARRKAIQEQEYQSRLSTLCFIQKYLSDLALIPERSVAAKPAIRMARAKRCSPAKEFNRSRNPRGDGLQGRS